MWLLVNVEGSSKDNKKYSKCGGKVKLVYCAIYHHYYCLDYNSDDKTGETSQPKYGAINTMLSDKENKTIC